MALPKKYKKLLETQISDVEVPDYLWLTYAVCACSQDACGWAGWMIEAVFKKTSKQDSTTGRDRLLNAIDEQICPRCKKELFRTEATVRYVISADQHSIHGIPGIDYDVAPMEYDDE